MSLCFQYCTRSILYIYKHIFMKIYETKIELRAPLLLVSYMGALCIFSFIFIPGVFFMHRNKLKKFCCFIIFAKHYKFHAGHLELCDAQARNRWCRLLDQVKIRGQNKWKKLTILHRSKILNK